MSVNTKLTNLANEIREISGTTTKKSLDVMASDISAANDLIDEQETLLNDLRDIVDTLPEPGIDTSDATANAQTIASGYTAYVKGSKVTGSVPQRTSNDVTASGATVNIPAGFYMGTASKTITTGKATTPTTTITATPTISINSAGKITASTSASKTITPTITAGYISSGTAGTVTVSGSNTKQLTTKAATTYTPGTSNQTIAASTYLTGAQTIKGDSNLVASNIKNGVSIFGVAGSYTDGIDGITQGPGSFGAKDILIDGSKIQSDTTGVSVAQYTGKQYIGNSTVDLEIGAYSNANVTVGRYSEVNIIDGGTNTITATNLSAENIKSGIDILGTVGTLEPATDGVVYHSDENGNDGLSIDRSFSYIDIKQENEIYTYTDCYIMPSGNLWFNEADGTTDLYINTIFDNIVISEDNRVEIQNRNCDLNFNGETYVVINAEDGMGTDLEINSSFNHIEFNAGNRITVYDSELIIASDESGSLELEDFSGQVSAPTLIPENIKVGVNILGVTGSYSGGTKSYGSHLIEVADGYYEYIIPDSAHFIIDCSGYYMGDLDGVAIRINGSTKLCFGNDRGSSGMNIGLDDYEYVHVFIKGSYATFVSEGGSCYIHDEQAFIQGFEIATIGQSGSVSVYVTHEI